MLIQTSYTPVVIAATSTNAMPNAHGLGKFLVSAAGTVTVTDNVGAILTAFPVTLGQVLELGIDARGNEGFTFTTAGGAAGTLLYW